MEDDGTGHEPYFREDGRENRRACEKAPVQQRTWNLEGTAKRPMGMAWSEQESIAEEVERY